MTGAEEFASTRLERISSVERLERFERLERLERLVERLPTPIGQCEHEPGGEQEEG